MCRDHNTNTFVYNIINRFISFTFNLPLHALFIVVSELYGQTGQTAGTSIIRYQSSEETVEFVEEPAIYDQVNTLRQQAGSPVVHDSYEDSFDSYSDSYEDPISTFQCTTPVAVNEGQEECDYATIDGLDGETICETTPSTVHTNNQQNIVSYYSSPPQQVCR